MFGCSLLVLYSSPPSPFSLHHLHITNTAIYVASFDTIEEEGHIAIFATTSISR